LTEIVAPLLVFVVFVISTGASGRPLDSASAFSVLSVVTLLASPVNDLIRAIPMINTATACFARIQAFLESDARRDHRMPINPLPGVETYGLGMSPIENNRKSLELQQFPSSAPTQDGTDVIVARNASFAWSFGSPPVIQEASFTIHRHKFTFIIGPVGSGKTTLLKGLMGETPSSKGFVYSSSMNAAYVEQTPWIINGTIRSNILGVSTYEESWYKNVVWACGLEKDITIMPNGHSTQVGSAGISLSGGQKQRLALARAVYSKQSFIILDDVFSGLDAQTEDHVFSELLGDRGLLRSLGSTVLLVTHAIHRLPYSDYIIALDSTGHVAEQGSFESLQTSNGYLRQLAPRLKSSRGNHVENGDGKTTILSSQLPVEIKELVNEVAELNRQTGERAVYSYYFSSLGWTRVAIYTMLVVVFAVSSSMTQLLLTFWTGSAATRGNTVNGFYLGIYGTLTLIAFASLISLCW